MAPPKVEHIDFLGSEVQLRADQATLDILRQLRLAENVLSSYSSSMDFLAEALQNATDAIDARRSTEKKALAKIHISFDVKRKEIAVADTGTGISHKDLRLVLFPNFTTKSGVLAEPRQGRSRGEKGVGLSFLALAANRLVITTCDGLERYELTVLKGNAWVESGGVTDKPMGVLRGPLAADTYLGSTRYTIVTVGQIDPEPFEQDLFSLDPDELEWRLRTATAVGNTASLFGHRKATSAIEVTLAYTDALGTELPERSIPYRYWSPEEFIPSNRVVDADDLDGLTNEELQKRLAGQAVRYVARWKTASHVVDMYVLIIDGREMMKIRDARREKGEFFPDEDWQGFYVAARDMPAGFTFEPRVIQPRPYLRRIFALMQDDELKLDLGRKTLAARTLKMMREVVVDAWNEDLRKLVPRVKPSEDRSMPGRHLSESALIVAATKRARALPDIDFHVPYQKAPDKAIGVLALFHELVGRGRKDIPALHTVLSGVISDNDELAYIGPPNGRRPVHVLYAFSASQIVDQLEREESTAEAVGLAVVWKVDEDALERRGVDVRLISGTKGSSEGATHQLMLRGLGGREVVNLFVLGSLETRG